MSMKRRAQSAKQTSLFVATQTLPTSPGHPFYEKLNKLLDEHGFDEYVEDLCVSYYHATLGRRSIPPGVYFRMLMVGYFEGLDSERGIAWRVADSLSLRRFLGFDLSESTPDHTSLSKIRNRLPASVYESVFRWVLQLLKREGLLRGETVAVDATTLEANAALRALVRRDSGMGYREYLQDLARGEGIDTPTREDEARIDKQRPRKASNKDWQHPHDPQARVAKMKDGRTHLAHKLEQVVDLDTQAVLGVRVTSADAGDTQTISATLAQADANVAAVAAADPVPDPDVRACPLGEVVADKGYHSNEVLETLRAEGRRTYIAEPKRGRRKWKGKHAARDAVYANRRRIRGRRSKALQRQRAERTERPFAHSLETGAMRRTHLRGHEKISKRMLIHYAGVNLGLAMRTRYTMGTPRGLHDLLHALLRACVMRIWRHVAVSCDVGQSLASAPSRREPWRCGRRRARPDSRTAFSPGC